MTAGAGEALKRNGQPSAEFVSRHQHGDWGSVPGWMANDNNRAIGREKRIMSSYRLTDGQVIWVVTAKDRSLTKILLPWESALTSAAASPWRSGWVSFWQHSAAGRVAL